MATAGTVISVSAQDNTHKDINNSNVKDFIQEVQTSENSSDVKKQHICYIEELKNIRQKNNNQSA